MGIGIYTAAAAAALAQLVKFSPPTRVRGISFILLLHPYSSPAQPSPGLGMLRTSKSSRPGRDTGAAQQIGTIARLYQPAEPFLRGRVFLRCQRAPCVIVHTAWAQLRKKKLIPSIGGESDGKDGKSSP
ncbi:hypothetical protein K456DRAFT_48147 [Colletotrichum gloeosporioides 23]|nr:hypothetical protein K456DRAFT_48147 [Colletotrichum gloeosporioides 23]